MRKRKVVEILTDWIRKCKAYDGAQFNTVYICDQLSDYIAHGIVSMDTITAVEILLTYARDQKDLNSVLSFMIYS